MLSACQKGGEWQLASCVFHASRGQAVYPNTISYDACISSGEKAGQWQLGIHLLYSMYLERIERIDVSFNAAISALEKAGRWQIAVQTLRTTAEVSGGIISKPRTCTGHVNIRCS